MPQIPVYNGPQVRTNELRTVGQQAPDVSSGLRAVGQGLGALGEVADKIVQRDAQDEAFRVEAQLRNDWQQHRAELRKNYKGDLADQYQAAAAEWWKEAPRKYGESLSPLGRRIASKSLENYRLQADADTLGYVEGEKKRARDINYRSLQQSLISEAQGRVTPGNAVAVGEELAAQVTRNAIAYATAEGLDGAKVGEQMAREQLDKVHTTVALALAGRPGGGDAARQYLAKFGESMDVADRTRVLDLIDVEADRVKTRVVRDTVGQLMLGIERGQFPKKADVDALAVVDPTAAAQVQRAINAEIKARKTEAKGGGVKTDQGAYFELRDKILNKEPVDILAYRDRVSRGDLEEAKKLQEKMAQPDKEKDIATTTQMISAAAAGMKDEKKGAFQIAVLDELNRLEKSGKTLTYEEKRKTIDRMLLDGEVLSGKWYANDPNKKFYEATPEERRRFVPTIVRADRNLIVKALADEGVKNPTEQQIIDRFKLAKGFQ